MGSDQDTGGDAGLVQVRDWSVPLVQVHHVNALVLSPVSAYGFIYWHGLAPLRGAYLPGKMNDC